MATALWGYKTFNRSEVPTLVWVGSDLDAGLKLLSASAEKLGLVRAERQQIIGGFQIPIPESESAKAARVAQEAEERTRVARVAAESAAKSAAALLAKAKKEADEAEAALAALSANPSDQSLKITAEKEKAEAETAARQAAEFSKHRRK